jgi:hypothetical protein
MTTQLGEMDLEDAAKLAAGNWRQFKCFAWYRTAKLLDADSWCIVYTHHRDSGLLDQSNAAAIEKALAPLLERDDPDVVAEHHYHWACGWIAGFSIRVIRGENITDAFRTYHDLAARLEHYPVLDETDYSNREYDATISNIGESAWRLKRQYALPLEWEADVYAWLSDHRPSAVDNVDDQGGYPKEADLQAAIDARGYARA